MDVKLLKNLQQKENLCKNYQRQASEIMIHNGMQPSVDQCELLQMAADLECDMAAMTIGAEKEHHVREKNRLDYEIMRIRSQLDLAAGKAPAKESAGSKDGKGGAKVMGNDGSENAKKSKEEEELDRSVRTWYKEAPKHSFDDVSGMSDLKKKLFGCIDDAKAQGLMDYLKIPRLNSYFFVGPPGCGKTYIIEAFAHELMEEEYKYISILGSDIISRYVGAAEKSVTRLFEEAENNAPCIVFIDEVDSLCKNRSLPNLPEYAANITTSFLTGYNRIHSTDSKVIFIAATNYPNRVDNAMLDRAEIVRVSLPDEEARAAEFQRRFKDMITLQGGLTFEYMAQATPRYNYRDIERLTTNIKRAVFKDVLDLFKDEKVAVEMLQSGKYKLSKFKFDEIKDRFSPSPKENILNDLKEWEREVKTIADYDDTDIDTVYEPDAKKEKERQKAAQAAKAGDQTPVQDGAEEPKVSEPVQEEPAAEPAVTGIVPTQEAFTVDPVSGVTRIAFKLPQGQSENVAACIDGAIFHAMFDGQAYSFEYTPQGGDQEAEVFVSDVTGYIGSFTARFQPPIAKNSEFDI